MRRAGPEPEGGYSIVWVAGLVVGLGLTVAATALLRNAEHRTAEQIASLDNLERIETALLEFAMINRRLPCPADPAGDGAEDPAGGGVCNHPQGVVPWKTLRLPEQAGLDGWGRRVSYRVDDLTTDTATGGVDMTDCNTDATADGTLEIANRCDDSADHLDHPDDFLLNRGVRFQVMDAPDSTAGVADEMDPATGDGAAFVLISHGPSGEGAWLPSGAQAGAPTGHWEAENLANAPPGPFHEAPFNHYDVALTSAGHFDDILRARKLSDFAVAAGLGPQAHGTPGGGGGGGEEEDCTEDVFASALGSTGGKITIEKDVQLLNLSGPELSAPTGQVEDKDEACGGVECTASGTAAGTLDVPDAPPNDSDIDYELDDDESDTFTADVQYKSVKIEKEARLTIDGATVVNVKDDFKLEKDSRLHVASGDVTIYVKEFKMDKETVLSIAAGATLTIIASGDIDIDKDVRLNEDGSPGQLLIMSKKDIEIDKDVRASAYLFAAEEIDIDKDARITGALTAEKIKIDKDSIITYSADAPTAVTSHCP